MPSGDGGRDDVEESHVVRQYADNSIDIDGIPCCDDERSVNNSAVLWSLFP